MNLREKARLTGRLRDLRDTAREKGIDLDREFDLIRRAFCRMHLQEIALKEEKEDLKRQEREGRL